MMKKKYFLNANIIDPKNGLEEIGGLIVNEEGKIEADTKGMMMKKLLIRIGVERDQKIHKNRTKLTLIRALALSIMMPCLLWQKVATVT